MSLPETLEVWVYGGADGAFDLYEDDGETTAYRTGEYCLTSFSLQWRDGNTTCFRLCAGEAKPFMPGQRNYVIALMGIEPNDTLTIRYSDPQRCAEVSAHTEYRERERELLVNLTGLPWGVDATFNFGKPLLLAPMIRLRDARRYSTTRRSIMSLKTRSTML